MTMTYQIIPLKRVLSDMIEPAYALLPAAMRSDKATVMLLSMGCQESKFKYPFQVLDPDDLTRKGPARGYWQFELGTPQSRGGVWGLFLHKDTTGHLRLLCDERNVAFSPTSIWRELEFDNVLAAGVARLGLWANAKPLPAITDTQGSYLYYLETWRPGKPHKATWPQCHANARGALR